MSLSVLQFINLQTKMQEPFSIQSLYSSPYIPVFYLYIYINICPVYIYISKTLYLITQQGERGRLSKVTITTTTTRAEDGESAHSVGNTKKDTLKSRYNTQIRWPSPYPFPVGVRPWEAAARVTCCHKPQLQGSVTHLSYKAQSHFLATRLSHFLATRLDHTSQLQGCHT